MSTHRVLECRLAFVVAMTRPKRHLCIIGDSDTVGKYGIPDSSPQIMKAR